jgi:DNA mismatch repair ATPase MutS
MSGWLDAERKRTANTEAKKNDIDEVSNLMYQFISTVNRIETLSKDINTPKDTDNLRLKLRKAREKAKKEAQMMANKLDAAKEQVANDEGHDEKQFGKLLKQYKEIWDRFQKVYRESQEKEKNSVRGQMQQGMLTCEFYLHYFSWRRKTSRWRKWRTRSRYIKKTKNGRD